MTEKIYKVRLMVDVYYTDPEDIIGKDLCSENTEIANEVQNTVLNIVDYAEEEKLLQPDCGVKLLTWHAVVDDPTCDFVDELPIFKEENTDGV
ncbi:hypothetical protein CMI41_01120 [Candidatus Pacearchaeota archaeon]|nr:hypothetical protein [Candidatus Pacearchaeota archaeon]|tara:strand:- start:1033 stop:1311 length:279 start_codon:yes stop_codon:yes gene_type:complete